jgi:hypothetical protein
LKCEVEDGQDADHEQVSQSRKCVTKLDEGENDFKPEDGDENDDALPIIDPEDENDHKWPEDDEDHKWDPDWDPDEEDNKWDPEWDPEDDEDHKWDPELDPDEEDNKWDPDDDDKTGPEDEEIMPEDETTTYTCADLASMNLRNEAECHIFSQIYSINCEWDDEDKSCREPMPPAPAPLVADDVYIVPPKNDHTQCSGYDAATPYWQFTTFGFYIHWNWQSTTMNWSELQCAPPCGSDTDCPAVPADSKQAKPECLTLESNESSYGKCEIPCKSNADCGPGKLCSTYTFTAGHCHYYNRDFYATVMNIQEPSNVDDGAVKHIENEDEAKHAPETHNVDDSSEADKKKKGDAARKKDAGDKSKRRQRRGRRRKNRRSSKKSKGVRK